MANAIAPEALFEVVSEDRVLIDVRTPAEYAHGHIPGAVNLPLFSNEERAEVGTLYKQVNPSAALLKGLDFVGGKMSSFVRQASRLAPNRKVAVHCWRGGKRSGSMAWLLGFADFDVTILQGGYKAYRQYLLEALAGYRFDICILGGHTGSGKTEVLHELHRQGEFILDLEALARHKGSAFGAMGEMPQPTVEQFENDLFDAFRKLPTGVRVWIEDESQSIGRVYIPPGFWQQMSAAPMLRMDMPVDIRVKKLVATYACFPKADLIDAFERIRKRLGGQHLKAAVEALDRDDFFTAAGIALRYYDKAYAMTQSKRAPELIYP
ncbi:MAG: tRNA 2-selenouridine(34) synthase MnmH, partial [Saprospiraceae bacterium]|nr:tRNA 2-selenouridine(34) synthase MnmH [Saprospiraceae bacterium]